MDNTDIWKYSLDTPRSIERGIIRIWSEASGPPTSDRIIHDVLLTIDSMYKVYEVKGESVPELYDRDGHRMIKGSRGK